MNVLFDMLGLAGVTAHFGQIDRGVASLRPLWAQYGVEFYAQETSYLDRADFAPLSPAYAERKRKQYGEKPILRASDALFESLTQQGAAGNIHRIGDLEAEFGTDDFKATLHQEGTDRMPARPPLADPDEERYESLAVQYLDDLIA